MNKTFRLVTVTSLSSCLWLAATQAAPFSLLLAQGNPSRPIVAQSSQDNLKQIAQSITVKILAGDSRGSGIIVAKQGQTYTVVTSAHGVQGEKTYRIQTPDGKVYTAILQPLSHSSSGNDIALLTFTSPFTYVLATLGDSKEVAPNQVVYAAGFPFDSDQLVLNRGRVSIVAAQPLVGGYQIGFSNATQQGMSGGALLNAEGKVIGILGQGANAILDNAYTYEDGSKPDEQTLEQMRQASFAVPIAAVQPFAPQIGDLNPTPQQPGTTRKYTGIVAEVDHAAQQVTVRIDSQSNGNGSGVIVARNGQTYYVLTAAHVVEKQDSYQIIAPDGKAYPMQTAGITRFEAVDLAVIPFISDQNYSIVTIRDEVIYRLGQGVFVSGFPGSKSQERILTRGTAFLANRGAFLADVKDAYSLSSGYDLTHTALSYPGMSGGGILDRYGRLVGINAAADAEIMVNQAGQNVEIPMGMSLGVPVTTFLALVSQSPIRSEWLKVEKPKEITFLTDTEATDIKSQFVNPKPPAQNADALEWFKYGNLIWRFDPDPQDKNSISALSQAIKLKPDFYQAYYARGIIYWRQDKNREALADFQKVIELQPSWTAGWRWKGYILDELKRYSESVAAYDKAIALDPQDFSLYLIKGFALLQLKDIQEALSTLNQSLQIKPTPTAYASRGSIYFLFFQREPQKAIADINKALELQPDYNMAYAMRGNVYASLGNIQQALADLNQAIQIKPEEAHHYFFRGQVYKKIKDYPKAIADFKKAIELEPQNPEHYVTRGSYYLLELKDRPKAIEDYTKAAELAPEGSFNKGSAYSQLASLYYEMPPVDKKKATDNAQKSVEQFTKYLSTIPKDSNAYFLRGTSYWILKDLPKAIQNLTRTIELNPENQSAYDIRGSVYSEAKEYDKAVADFSKAIELTPNNNEENSTTYVDRGKAYAALLDYPKAIADYTEAIRLDPKNARAYRSRGHAYYDLKEYSKAIADFTEAIRLDPKNADAYAGTGDVYHKLKDYPKALADYTKAIDIQSDFAGAYGARGVVYQTLKDYPRAIADYTKAIEFESNPAKLTSLYSLRGIIYSESKDYPKAIADFTKLIEMKPDDPSLYILRAEAYRNLQEYNEAITDSTQAIDLKLDNTDGYLLRGDAYRFLQDYPKAIADYTKAIEMKPDDPQTYILRGEAYRNLQEYNKAIVDYTKAIELKPYDPQTYILRGEAYRNLQEYNKAIVDFTKAIELKPDDVNTYFSRSLVYMNQKNFNAALVDCQQVLSKDSKFIPAITNIGLIKYEMGDIDTAMTQWRQAIALDDKLAEPQLALAVALHIQGRPDESFSWAQKALKLDAQFSSVEYLKKNAWGDLLVADAQKLLATPEIRAILSH